MFVRHTISPWSIRCIGLILVALMLAGAAACEVEEDVGVTGDDPEVVEQVDGPTPIPALEPTPTTVAEATSTTEDEPEIEPVAELEGEMMIYHFDVGQADATLISAPEVNILIDAGDWQSDDVNGHLRSVGIESIDLFILTHPHADHIGQVPQVMQNFEVGEVWMSGWEHDTATFANALDAVLESDAGYHEPRAGESETFGDVEVEVVHPAEPLNDMHDGIAVRIVFGEFNALYTGDSEVQHETEMLNRDNELDSTLLQLGHHGSSTSSTAEFLSAVDPEIAVYSAGVDNQYGHPHGEVVDRVLDNGVELYGTNEHGTIVVATDGESYSVDTQYESDTVAAPPLDDPATEDEVVEEDDGVDDSDEPETPEHCVDINSVSAEQLQEIDHIGPERAEVIINLRPFDSVESLTRVDGIGPSRIEDILEQGLACVQ